MTNALVVLSGGQDSATCMAWASTMFDSVRAISFDYGQRHKRELESASSIAKLFNAPFEVVDMSVLKGNPSSGLTSQLDVREIDTKTSLPKSFVPGRNLIFLTSAASIALTQGISDIVTGVCQTDYSGYPDCRRETVEALERAINLGNAGLGTIRIHTPLMFLTKAETVLLAKRLPLGWEAISLSWTCYEGGKEPCGVCPACLLRIKGFDDAGLTDPALRRKNILEWSFTSSNITKP